jgi:hypothetical protein
MRVVVSTSPLQLTIPIRCKPIRSDHGQSVHKHDKTLADIEKKTKEKTEKEERR